MCIGIDVTNWIFYDNNKFMMAKNSLSEKKIDTDP